ncbi:ChrR family anti-sigma-E factor [Primorskyibacter sp. 2E107]|uniref:ChrR family anti-sigma-E factor n=1 Tax=Primorskyibacter sp. 2E107 TaxID=3403458 RepID=UPI003AF703DF
MTDMITHHLTDDLILGYSAGTLPEAVNLVVATHISMCDNCRAALAAHDAVGGALVEAASPARVQADSLSNVLARIHAGTPEPQSEIPRTSDVPAPLADYVGGSLSDVKWRSVGLGVKQAVLKTSPEATARLLYIPAGTAVPDHGHNGLELTLVLQGAFSDEDGTFGPGDIEVATDDLEHTPIADISADCICLAVTDAPLKFKGWLPRLAQPFVGI